MIYEITTRLEALTLNTVISGFMEFTNKLVAAAKNAGGIDKDSLETLAILLCPFAPHIAEEIWQILGHDESVFRQTWPKYDEGKLKEDTVNVAVQINGKVKANIDVAADADKDTVLSAAKEALGSKLSGTIIKEIYVPGRICNIVVKP